MLFLENLISGTLPFVFLTVCGIYLSVKTKLCQITRFSESIRLTAKAYRNKESSAEITSFKAACTALSATVGTGNIAGVAGAISIGGAGAIFWMWISATLGMCIKAAEITLAVLYRERKENKLVGGPVYYIKNGLGKSFQPLGYLFCLASIPAVFCSGNITQTNAAIISFCSGNIQRLVWGLIFAIACFVAIKGNINKIAALTEKIVPPMSVLYIVLSLIVITANIQSLPDCFRMIFEGAFNPKAVTGGAVGSLTSCIFIGSSRGIFSNEAGLGTSAMAHSVAVDTSPKTQGLFGIFEVFVDTILLCTLTALTILCSGVKINYGVTASTELVRKALNMTMGSFGSITLSIMMCLFAFSSIIGWAVYGRISVSYIFGDVGNKAFTFIYPLSCILGAVFNSAAVWRMAGVCNGIMLCTNLTALLLLSKKAEPYLKRGKQIEDKRNSRYFKGKRCRNNYKRC